MDINAVAMDFTELATFVTEGRPRREDLPLLMSHQKYQRGSGVQTYLQASHGLAGFCAAERNTNAHLNCTGGWYITKSLAVRKAAWSISVHLAMPVTIFCQPS